MKLWIGNMEPNTTDEELATFIAKYAPQLAITGIQRVEGDGSRPAASIEFDNPPAGALEQAALRLHGMYWKGRELFVQTLAR